MIPTTAEGIDYLAFGGRLRSQLEFPDLSRAPGREAPDRQVSVSLDPPPEPIEPLGTREVEPGWMFHLHRVSGGMRLDYRGTGCFEIRADGRTIVWYPDPDSELEEDFLLEVSRAILLGPAMALALHQMGILCLHGSAVTIGGQAVAFLAPKHFGKSTLALALTAAGARLMTDDLVAIDARSSPVALPGVHSVRLMANTAEQLGEAFSHARIIGGYKKTLTDLPPERLAWDSAPLVGIYVIRPVVPIDAGPAAARDRLRKTRAASSLAHEKKLTDELIGFHAAGEMLQSIAHIAETVPVYRLSVPRELARLPHVVREIMTWHGEPHHVPETVE